MAISRTDQWMMELVGSKVRQARETLGWTQQELADEVGIGRSQIVNIECARCMPSWNLFMKLCKVFETTPNWMLGYTKRMR